MIKACFVSRDSHLLFIRSELQQENPKNLRWEAKPTRNVAKFDVDLTCVMVYRENAIFIATKYGVGDPLSAVSLLHGLYFRYPSALTERNRSD